MIGVVSRKNGAWLLQRRAEVAGKGAQALRGRSELRGQRPVFSSVVSVWSSVRREELQRLRSRPSSDANASKLALAESTSAASWRSRRASAVESSWKLWMTRRMFPRRLASSRVSLLP